MSKILAKLTFDERIDENGISAVSKALDEHAPWVLITVTCDRSGCAITDVKIVDFNPVDDGWEETNDYDWVLQVMPQSLVAEAYMKDLCEEYVFAVKLRL